MITVTMRSARSSSPSIPISPKSTTAATISTCRIPVSSGISCPQSRRHVLLLPALIPSLLLHLQPQPAFAFNIGISGPKDWLKDQKKKSIKYLLAPIDASRDILQYAYQVLMAKNSGHEQKDVEKIQGLLRSAARDCVPEERNSLVAFQAKTGVEVCTFKLIVKNASSLLDDSDTKKMAAEAMLSELTRSFAILIGLAKEAKIEIVSDREKIADALMDALSSLEKFEQGIKGAPSCLPCATCTHNMFTSFLYGVLFTSIFVMTIIATNHIPTHTSTHHTASPLPWGGPATWSVLMEADYSSSQDDGSSGSGSGGVGDALMRTFPTFAYSSRWKSKMGKGESKCVICQTKFREGEMLRWLPECDHVFHLSCIDKWLASHESCPCCRAQLQILSNEIYEEDFEFPF